MSEDPDRDDFADLPVEDRGDDRGVAVSVRAMTALLAAWRRVSASR